MRQVCCLKQRRAVANDDTMPFAGHRLQLLPGRGRLTYARATVEVRHHPDDTLSIWYGDHELAWRRAPPDARALRGRAQPATAAAEVPPPKPPTKPGPNHPWRKPLKPQKVTFSRTNSG